MKRKSAAAIAAAAVLTLGAAMGMGYAAWSTMVTGSGSVTAAGNWDVAVTDASVRLSSAGAALSSETVYTFEKTEEAYSNAYKYVGTLSTNDTIKGATEENHATQSELPMQEAAAFYAIDTSRTSWETVESWNGSAEQISALIADETTVDLDGYLHAYYRYNNMPGKTTAEIYQDVVDAFVADTEALLKELYPDTWMNYAIATLVPNGPSLCYEIAAMNAEEVPGETSVENGTAVDYADVVFGIPGAWAEYSLTVTNNGTVPASLSGANLSFETDQPEQLVMNAPDLSDEVVAPGESCTITVVVEALDDGSGSLNASGSLTIEMPFTQQTVEEAPAPSHSHQAAGES